MSQTSSILLVCPACKSRRQVPRELIGKKVRCRQCTAELQVDPSNPDDDGELLLADAPMTPAATVPEMGDAAGMIREDISLAPMAEQPLASAAPPLPDEDYRVGALPEPPPGVKAILLAPPPPDAQPPDTWVKPPDKKTLRWSFTSGIFTYCLRPNALPQWVVFSGCLLISSWMISTGFQYFSAGLGAIAGGCFSSIGLFAAIAAMLYGSACLIAIVENTAYHLDKESRWPEHDYREWLFHFLRLLYLLTLCCLLAGPPAALASLANQALSTIVAATVIYLSFPILLLSALESDSILLPVSAPILRSLAQDWGAWIAFYTVSGLLWAGSFGATLAIDAYAPAIPLLLSAAIAGGAWFSYARLVGRLASYIMHLDEREQERRGAKKK